MFKIKKNKNNIMILCFIIVLLILNYFTKLKSILFIFIMIICTVVFLVYNIRIVVYIFYVPLYLMLFLLMSPIIIFITIMSMICYLDKKIKK